MIRQRNVTIFTGVVNATALHFDGDDVAAAFVVSAAGLWIDVYTLHFWWIQDHISQ